MGSAGAASSRCSRQQLQQLLALAAGGTLLLLTCHLLSLRPAAGGLPRTAQTLPAGTPAAQPGGRPWEGRRWQRAWFTSPECRPLVTRFARQHSLPLVYLASVPGSGETRVRRLLEMASGLLSSTSGTPHSSTDTHPTPAAAPQLPGGQGSTVITATSLMPEPWSGTATGSLQRSAEFPLGSPRKAVLLIRDPFKVLLSVRRAAKTGSAAGEDRTEFYQGSDWHQFVANYSQQWYNFNTRWILSTNETMIAGYERLKYTPIDLVTKILDFLGIKPDTQRVECLRLHLGDDKREDEHQVIPVDKIFPPALRTEVWTHIHMLNMLLRDRKMEVLMLKEFSFAEGFANIYDKILQNRY